MTYGATKFGVRINGKMTWFKSQAEAQRIEDEILWGAHQRAALAGKSVIMPAHIAKRMGVAAASMPTTDSSET